MIHNTLSFQITWDCNARCMHCFQNHQDDNLSIDKTKELIDFTSSKFNLYSINFTGGEPFLRYEFLKEIIQFNNSLNLKSRVITNCKWCNSEEIIYERLGELIKNNLDMVTISYDYFHSHFISYRNILMFINACNTIGLKVVIYATLSKSTERKTKTLINDLQSKTKVKVLYRWLVPINSKIKTKTVKIEDLPDCCSAQNIFTIWPSGEILPCCSVGTNANLSVGNINYDDIENLIVNRFDNHTLKILEHEGPKGIYHRLPNRMKVAFSKKGYVNCCHLCYELLNNIENNSYIERMQWNDIDIVDSILL